MENEKENWKELHLVIFNNITFKPLKNKVLSAMLQLIKNERHGEHVDRQLMKRICDIYVALGQTRNPEGTLEVYHEEFEAPFFKDTDLFYSREASKILSENKLSQYMIKAEARIDEELLRINSYLHPSTKRVLMEKCIVSLVVKKLKILFLEFEALIMNNKTWILRMYKLLSRIENGLQSLMETFEKHILQMELDQLEEIKQTAPKKPRQYVEVMLGVYKKYYRVVESAFEKDYGFFTALNKACQRFMNQNPVSEMDNSQSTSSELCARYCNLLLKKSDKIPEESQLEEFFDDLIVIFKYLVDKDVFLNFYFKMLANRLINKTSVSVEAERSMISKLRFVCVFGYFHNFEEMLKDIKVSRDMNEKFKGSLKEREITLPFDFEITVATTGFWPFSIPSTKFVIPGIIEGCVFRFSVYCRNFNDRRKLNWLHQLSTGELTTKILDINYIFCVSIYQMSLLLLFNEKVEIKFEEIQENSKLSDEFLECILAILVKKNILLATKKVHQEGTIYKVDNSYKNKRRKVQLNISMPIKKNRESQVIYNQIEEERNMLIQASINRIMMSNRSLTHEALIAEIAYHLKGKFEPNIKTIKKCIDLLIDKEFFERVEGRKVIYNYLN
ncbi:cullin-1 [Anaeramoeba flamelloides]|uniref:Cullin-1 n=1 Tax=Anaeramoeba flamelloides TaxID=1746091 RepID=A0AAV8A559_9EUKA|nr:cullin-1 [Anaeramoeba flamelloides]